MPPSQLQQRHIQLMRHSCDILGHVLSGVSQDLATTVRDSAHDKRGDDGWTVLEVVCHLRDYDDIFYHRVQMMLTQTHPDLPAYDHEALVIERDYNSQILIDVYADLCQSRQRFIDCFNQLNEADWARTGTHPERGHFTMTDALVQVGTHEVNHIEQITRILATERT